MPEATDDSFRILTEILDDWMSVVKWAHDMSVAKWAHDSRAGHNGRWQVCPHPDCRKLVEAIERVEGLRGA